MQQTQVFRVLILIDALLTSIGLFAEPMLSADIAPALLAAYTEAYPVENAGALVVMLALFTMVLAGYVGMWHFRQWGKLAYTTACIVDIVCLAFYKPVLLSGALLSLTIITGFSGGALLAMAWLSDVRREFK